MQETIFDRIITNENSFTELFKNFLRFTAFRDSFIQLIEIDLGLNKSDKMEFDTQFTISKFGRPDLVLTTIDTEILFEIKVYDTALTENQPKGYYNYLKKESRADRKGLILIAPKKYYNYEAYETNLLEVQKSSDNIHHQVICWETISELITTSELHNISPLFKEYSSFMIDWFQLRPIFYDSLNTTTMFGKHFPESLKKTMEIIEIQFNEFHKQGFKLKWASDKYFEEYGFYFTMPNNNEKLFVGIWFEYWEKSGNPVCITLLSDSDIVKTAFQSGLRIANLEPGQNFEKWVVSYFEKATLMEEKSTEKLSMIIREIISAMGLTQKEARSTQTTKS